MTLDLRKRQRKLERKKAKQRQAKKALAPVSMAARIARVASAPILHCFTVQDLWSQGMGHVVVSRELSHGDVAVANFLVDMYCLGVKNALGNIIPRGLYMDNLYNRMVRDYQIVKLQPECARKLVEGAVEYARGIGFSPHSDYAKAKMIFGSIDPSACTQEFTYGKDGKPFFINGPHDNMERCRRIISTLEEHCGAGNFDSLFIGRLPHLADRGLLANELDWENEDEFDEGDVDEDDDLTDDPNVVEGEIVAPDERQ